MADAVPSGSSDSGSSSNTMPAISTSSPGSKPSASSARDHADPAQPPLEVGERLLVVEVVAGEQPLDPRAVDREAAVAGPLDREARGAAGPEDAVLGELASVGERGQATLPTRRRRHRAGASGTRRSSSFASSRDPARLADEVTITGTSAPSRSRHARGPPRAVAASTRSAFDSARIRGSAARRGSWRRARPRPSRSCSPGRSRRAAPGRARARAAACARRGRGTRGRARRRRWRPRSAPGCRRSRAGGRRASSVPSTGCERRERVVGDLRLRAGQPREQRRLAGVGQPDQADVGEQLELQRRATSPRRAARARRTAASGGSAPAKRLLPRPPEPPRATTARWPGDDQVVAGAVGLDEDLGARRHRDLERLRRRRRGAASPRRGRRGRAL